MKEILNMKDMKRMHRNWRSMSLRAFIRTQNFRPLTGKAKQIAQSNKL